MAEPILRVEELETHLYSREGIVKPVNKSSFEINQGETLGIVGESGFVRSRRAAHVIDLQRPKLNSGWHHGSSRGNSRP